MDINIDLGNFWEMLASISTTAAVIISLYLALKEYRKEIKVEIGINEYNRGYLINIIKSPNDYFLITEYGYKINFKNIKICDTNVEILDSTNRHRSFGLPIDFLKENLLKINLTDFDYNELLNTSVKFYVKDFDGKVYYSKKVKLQDISK